MRLAGHPIHPMLVHFPIALWTIGVAADLGGWITGADTFWAASFACQALGVLIGALAMLFGFVDFASISRQHPAHGTAVLHMLWMCTAWLLFLVSLALRGLPANGVAPIGATAVALLGFACVAAGGWLGGRLVYGFGVGVTPQDTIPRGNTPRPDRRDSSLEQAK